MDFAKSFPSGRCELTVLESLGEFVSSKALLKGIEAVAACGLRTLNAEQSWPGERRV